MISDQFSNRAATPVNLTEDSLEQMLKGINRFPGVIRLWPTYLISRFPLPPRRTLRYRLISAQDAMEYGIPKKSLRPCSAPSAYWVDKRCLSRYRRREYDSRPGLWGFGLPPLRSRPGR